MLKKKKPTFIKIIAILGAIMTLSNFTRIEKGFEKGDNIGNVISLIIISIQLIAYLKIISFKRWAILLLFPIGFFILLLNIFSSTSDVKSYFQPLTSMIFWGIIYIKNKDHFE
jgi:hypothetical protein